MRFRNSFAIRISLVLMFIAAAVAMPSGQAAKSQTHPAIHDLCDCEDYELQSDLEQAMERLGLQQAVEDRRLAVSVVDLSCEDEPRLAMLNGYEMMYAASLPKIAILLGAFVQAERGELELDRPTISSLTRMIRSSSNADASAMLSKVGEQTLLDILQSPRYHFYDPLLGGGLWVGKAYNKAPAYSRDPLRGLSHAATAFQVARFYYLLDQGMLVSPELTGQMKAALSEPAICHKFVKGLESKSPMRLYRKSGTWQQFHSDSVLVEDGFKRYILVGIAADPKGGVWLEQIAPSIDDLFSSRAPLQSRRDAPESSAG